MAIIFKIALLMAGIIYAMMGVADDGDKDKKAANIVAAFMMFVLLWLSLMTL